MSNVAYGKTLQELVNDGWIILANEEADVIVGVRSVIRHWHSMAWAEQTYYTAEYGFNENGVLDIALQAQMPTIEWTGLIYGPRQNAPTALPEESLQGSNDRLLAILSRSRVAVANSRYDDDGLAHIGPDGTVILTNEYLWGLPDLRDDSYAYVDEGHRCFWEVSIATWCPDAPWWALGPHAADLSHYF